MCIFQSFLEKLENRAKVVFCKCRALVSLTPALPLSRHSSSTFLTWLLLLLRQPHRCTQGWIFGRFEQWDKAACPISEAELADREAAGRAVEYVYDNRVGW